ncbi:MAG: cob(I)alamin adenosyltransferase [Nitriliruptoraceae bacterium]|jgi:cob(I)alamin adenosyltransferase
MSDTPYDPIEASSTPTEAPPTELRARPKRVHKESLILVNTGNGKGKSSAAFGVALRGVARGWRVRVVQFLKSGEWKTGEAKMLPELGVEWWEAGDGFTWNAEDLDESQALALAAWEDCKARLQDDTLDMLLLDEVTYPINWGWIELDDVLDALRNRSPKVHVVITGRDCPPEIMELADTVTEMREVKHAFHEGVMARKGFDY